MILVRVRHDDVFQNAVRAETVDIFPYGGDTARLGPRIDEHFGISDLDQRTVPRILIPQLRKMYGKLIGGNFLHVISFAEGGVGREFFGGRYVIPFGNILPYPEKRAAGNAQDQAYEQSEHRRKRNAFIFIRLTSAHRLPPSSLRSSVSALRRGTARRRWCTPHNKNR